MSASSVARAGLSDPRLATLAPYPWLLLSAALLVLAALPAAAQVVPPSPPPSFAKHLGGEWGPVLVWPHVPVSIANLPDGRVLTFASNEPNSFPGSLQDEYTHAAVWDPATGEIKEVPHPNHDMFCAALVMLESGEPFVMGGRNQGNSPWTSYFDYHNDRWVQIENMNRGRWYPTAVYLGSGEVLIAAGVGGGVNPEVWSPDTGWKLLTGIDLSSTILQHGTRDGSGSWPLLQLANNGMVFHHGANDRMNMLDPFGGPGGLGTLIDSGPHSFEHYVDEGVSVLYDEGKILVAGGSTSTSVNTAVPNSYTVDINAYSVDLSGPGPVIVRVADMNYPRQFQNEVMLPTGEVLVVGGNTSGAKFTDAFAITNAEVWDPDANTWTLLNAQDQARTYHSTAVLLPDGTVFSAGGGLAGDSCDTPEGPGECEDDHWNAEVFHPPYLFAADDSPAPRPSIDDAPGVVRVGSTFGVQATAGLSGFSMVRMSANTHTMNTDQRFLRPVSVVETAPGSYDLTLHDNENVLVPGYWMLFAMDGEVPSISKIVQVVNDGTPRGKPIPTLRNGISESVLVQVEAEDPDGNAVTFSATGLPTGLAIDPATGAVSGTTSAAGIFNVTVTADDGSEQAMIAFQWVVSSARSEFGTVSVSQANASQWHTVSLASTFADPIVVMGPPSHDDADPVTVRVRNVAPDGFEFKLDEWLYQDGAHGQESVSYLVVEAGEYLLPGGGTVVAGRSEGVDYENPRTQAFPPSVFIDTPLVLAQIASDNGPRAVTPRLRDVTTTRFEVRVQGEEAEGNNVDFEDVHWIALEPAAIPGLLSAEISPANVDENPQFLGYGQVFSGLPHLIATPQTLNGGDTASLRHDNAATNGADFIIDEEQSENSETGHNDEVVGWLAIDPGASTIGLLPFFNSPPVVATPADQLAFEGSAVSLFVQASDPDGDSLTFTATGLPPGLAIDPVTGEIAGTPTTAGTYPVTVSATDPSTDVGEASFLWTVQIPLELIAFPTPPDLVGNTVSYTAQVNQGGSFEFVWVFGDGNVAGPLASPDVSHVFATPGRYIVTLTVTDTATSTSDEIQFVQNVTAPATPLRPTASTSISYEPANDQVWVVNPDNDTVSVIDATSNTRAAEVPVCDDPRSVAVAGDGRVWVACKDDATLDVLDPGTWTVVDSIPLPYGSQPHGLVFDPTGAHAYVALEAAGRVLRLDGVSGAELAGQDVGLHVRHLAVSADGATVHAARFVTPPLPGEESGAPLTSVGGDPTGAEVLRLDGTTLAPGTTTILAASLLPDSEQAARGFPNYLGAPAISPQGDAMLVPSKQDNLLRGALRDGLALTHDSTVRAVSSYVDLTTGDEDLIARLDHDNASVASATIYSLSGSYAFTALEGNRQVSVVDPFTHFELGRVDTGRAPHGLALSPDGLTLYVDDFMDRTVSVLDLADLIDFDDAALPPLATISKVSLETLPGDVLLGKQLFYDAADPRLVLESYMACAACHNDGGQDGRTWDFTQFGEGLRNTITLEGHGQGHGPLHWSANFDEVQDFEGQIRLFALGQGLMSNADFIATADPLGAPKVGLSGDLDALAAYVESLTEAGDSPLRAAGALTAEAVAGRDVFADSGCGACHRGAAFTDSALGVPHDVGTLDPVTSGPQTALDTPTLRGLWNTPPYLHDGSQATIDGAVAAHAGVSIPSPELAQLVAYLEQIDDAELAAPNSTPTVNAPPDQTDAEGDTVSLVVDASDIDGDPLDFDASGLPDGLSIDPLTGEIGGTLTQTSAGSHTVTVSADDGLRVGQASFDWTVSAVNVAPVVTDPGAQADAEGAAVSLAMSASDADGDTLAWSATGLPDGLSIDPASGAISGTLSQTSAGTHAVTVTASDGSDPGQASFDWIVALVNLPPQLVGPVDQAGFEGNAVSLPMSASDGDGDTLGWSATGLPTGLAIDPATGLIGGTIAVGSAALYTVTVTVSDGSVPDQASFDWTVTVPPLPPVVTDPGAQATREGEVVSLGVSASDPNGDPLTFSATGLPPGLGIDPVTGEISGAPAPGSAAVDPYAATLTVHDGGASTDLSLDWTVLDPPPIPAEVGTVQAGSAGWTPVPLTRSYASMVVVATPLYHDAAVPWQVRVRNAAGSAFELRLARADGGSGVIVGDVHYLVVEEGVYDAAQHGASLEAVKYLSTVTDRARSFVGEARAYAQPYLQPVVVGQVMSANDPATSVFWARGASHLSPPDAAALHTGKTVNEDPNKTRADETIGYVVVEAGGGVIGDQVFHAAVGGDTVRGAVEAPPYVVPLSGLVAADVAVASLAGMDGPNGGWAVLYGPPDPLGGSLGLAVDEDQLVDAERAHTHEQVACLAFELPWSGPNQPPQLRTPPGDQLGEPGDAVSLALDVVDRDRDPLDFSATGLPDGLAIDPASGLVTGTLTPAALGSHAVEVAVSDGSEAIRVDFAWDVSQPVAEIGVVPGVSNTAWTPVTLADSYREMVVIAQPVYTQGSPPLQVRVRNAVDDGFELRLARRDGSGAPVAIDVHFLAVEAGVYSEAEHGATFEAVRFDSSLTASWVALSRTLANDYVSPVVIAQVQTANDPEPSIAWAYGASLNDPPSAGALHVGKHKGEGPVLVTASETIGYVVVEAGYASLLGLPFAAGVGADVVTGMDDAPPIQYPLAGLVSASVALLAPAGADGIDGGWPVLYGPPDPSGATLDLVIDEDTLRDPERNHTTEQVGWVVFE